MSKNVNYIGWDKYFMEVAKLSAQRSKDPNTQVGACVVDQKNRIIGIGYNGFPRGCSDDSLPWSRPEKYFYVCHAEVNALLNSTNFNLLEGATLYVTLFPCNECAKMIIQLGIKKIVYLEDKYPEKDETMAAKRMFKIAQIEYMNYNML